MQFKGLGIPSKHFATQKCFCIDENIACGCYETSQHAFQNLKIILQSGPSVFKFNLKRTVIFCKKNFSHLQPPQAGRAGTTSQFLNSILQIRLQKHLLDFAQTRYSAQNCAGYTFPLIPNKQIFLDKNLFYENRR